MRRSRLVFGIAALIVVGEAAGGVPAVHGAPIRWAQNGHYYELVSLPLTWPAACEAARAASHNGWSGHLATIGDAEENAFITSTVIGSPDPDPWGHIWIGGHQPPGSGEPNIAWAWETGEAWGYTNWGETQPDNWWDHQGDEDCTAWTRGGPGLWNDICAAQCHPYVIEYEDLSPGACPVVTVACRDAGQGCSAAPPCSDGIDNDGDGCADFPCDTGCTSADDGSEEGAGCATAARSVPPVFFGITGDYYEPVPGLMTWTAARDAARTHSFLGHAGHLATVTSLEENEFLRGVGGADHWVGGYQSPGAPTPSADWHWVDDDPWAYTHWADGEPNNSNHVDENYLEFMDDAGGWNDVAATDPNLAYLVEYDVGEPLAAPSGVDATDNDPGGVIVSWAPQARASRYRVLRDGTSVGELPATVTTFRDAPPDQADHLYCVEAVNGCGGHSGPSCDVGRWAPQQRNTKDMRDVDEPLMWPLPRARRARPAVIVEMPAPGHVRVDVFDLLGRRVGTLADRRLPAGATTLEWDPRHADGTLARAGVYFARLTSGASRASAPLVLAP